MMNTTNAEIFVQDLLAYTLLNNKKSLIYLLERNGVTMPFNPSDKEIITATLVASSKSTAFQSDLKNLLSSNFPKAVDTFTKFVGDETDFGFTGIDDFMYASGDGWFSKIFKKKDASTITAKDTKKEKKKPATVIAPTIPDNTNPAPETPPTTPDEKVGFWDFIKKNILTKDNVNKGLEFGFTALNNKLTKKQLDLEQQSNDILLAKDKLKVEAEKEKPKPPAKNNTLTFVLIGVSVLALGGILFVVLRNKNKTV